MRKKELKVYKLKKELYGLKQSPRAWNKRIDGFLNDVDFKKCVSKHGVYVKTDTSEDVIILCLYVDELLISGSNEKCISKINSEFRKKVEMNDFGIELHKSKRGLRMHQKRYALVSEERLRLGYCRSENQVADLLTKGVINDVFKRLKMNMIMEYLEHLNLGFVLNVFQVIQVL